MPRHPSGLIGAACRVLLAVAIALSAGVSCAGTPLAPSAGRWVHPRLGYAIDAPVVSPDAWMAIDIEGADLAYRRSDGATLSLMSNCARAAAPPALLARQLLIGTKERTVVRNEPIDLNGDPGWRLAFRTLEQGREVTVNAVTLASAGCAFDWLWIAPGRPGEAPWFDLWWASFAPAEDSR